jgi:hypothetical protein
MEPRLRSQWLPRMCGREKVRRAQKQLACMFVTLIFDSGFLLACLLACFFRRCKECREINDASVNLGILRMHMCRVRLQQDSTVNGVIHVAVGQPAADAAKVLGLDPLLLLSHVAAIYYKKPGKERRDAADGFFEEFVVCAEHTVGCVCVSLLCGVLCCGAVLCCVVLCGVVLCCVVLRFVWCCVVWCCVVLCCVVLSFVVLCCVVLCGVVLCCVVWCCVVLCSVVWC